MAAPHHLVISASAGSGKTFQLANRYIALLLIGIPPSRIVALTFSRKAAGEIFDKIVDRLANAARGDDRLTALRTALEQAGYSRAASTVSRESIRTCLRRLLSELHRSRIGTLDSFFVGVVRAFPFELGLSGSPDIVDGHAALLEKKKVLRQVLQPPASRPHGQGDFLEHFKQATFGMEEKNFGAALDAFVEEYHGLFLEVPQAERWGNPAAIWSAGPWWEPGETIDIQTEGSRLLELLSKRDLQARQQAKWQGFVQEALRYRAGDPVEGTLRYFLERVAEPWLLETQPATVKVFKEMVLTADESAAFFRLLQHVVKGAIMAQLQRTAGIFAVLSRYEETYNRIVRRRGRLGFKDIQFLLGFGALQDSRRMDIDYRLDGTFDHWLLDEFQDTSTIQWMALRELLGEVLQDESGRRTLFYVGDVKQAIYGWRGGDARLFHRIIDYYNQERATIAVDNLVQSFRSSPVVISTVNEVFGGLECVPGLPGSVVDEWKRDWRAHVAVKDDLPGFCAVYQMERTGNSKSDRQARFAKVAELLADVQPVARGLTAAVLVRSNSAGKEMVEYLRSQGIEAAWEGAYTIVDHPVVRAMLSLARFAAHPGDTMSLRYLEMTPLRPLLPLLDGDIDKIGLVLEVLDDINGHGFEYLVRKWTARLAGVGTLVPFSCRRLEELAEAAAQFDQSGERDCLEFVEFITQYQMADSASRRAVQVMTMHKAKGLEFDVVFLPELVGRRGITSYGNPGLEICKADSVNREARWVMAMPVRPIAAADPELAEFQRRLDHESCYEQLCLLYVAMTRAKQGLYMITTQPAKKSSAVHLSTVIHQQLAGGDVQPFEAQGLAGQVIGHFGDEQWYKAGTAPVVEAAAPLDIPSPFPAAEPEGPDVRSRLARRNPSAMAGSRTMAGQFFSLAARQAARLGSAVHELFEGVEWLDDADTGSVSGSFPETSGCPDELASAAASEFRRALEGPAVRKLLARPECGAEVWRERRFEAVLDGKWVSGCFDRVVLTFDGKSAVTQAQIVDFKTTRIESEEQFVGAVKRYTPQMKLYGEVLAQMTGLEESRIDLKLVFTHSGRVETIGSPAT